MKQGTGAGTIERDPDPTHRPRKGDQYINPTYGIAITVVAVGKRDGIEWVLWENTQGVRYKNEYERFVNTHRRVLNNSNRAKKR